MMKLYRKLKNTSVEVKASYWYIICNVFQKGLAFIAIPIYTRLLTTTEYGTYSVYTTWLGIISIFANLSLSAGFFNVGIMKYENEKDKFLSSVQGLSTVSTVVVIAACVIFYDQFCKLTGMRYNLLLIMAIQLLFSTPVLYWSAKQRFEYRYVQVVVITMLSSLATVGLSIVFIYLLPDKSYSLILGSAIIQTIVGAVFYLFNILKGKCFYDKNIWKYAASFGVTLIPHYLAYSILNSSDRVMINNMCSTGDAGIYSLACNISIAVNLVTGAIDSSLNPWVFQRLKNRNYKKIAKITDYIVFGFGMIVVGGALVAPEILFLVSSREYQSAKWVMPPVIAGCFFLYLAGCFMRVAFYHEKKHVITLTSILAAVTNIVLNFIFIPQFGFIAAAYTTLVSYIIFVLVHYISMRRICKVNSYSEVPFHSKKLLLISTFVVVFSIGFLTMYDMPILRYGIVVLILIIIVVNKSKVKRTVNEIRKK